MYFVEFKWKLEPDFEMLVEASGNSKKYSLSFSYDLKDFSPRLLGCEIERQLYMIEQHATNMLVDRERDERCA